MAKNIQTVFLSYAHGDVDLVRQLVRALRPLEKEGLISLWTDERIPAGMTWRQEITGRLANSDLIIPLLSADYIASDYCWGIEMKTALDNYTEGRSQLLPVILRPCDWRSTPLANLQVLPSDGRPVTEWSDVSGAFSDVVHGLTKVLSRAPTHHEAPSELPTSFVLGQPAVWNVPYPRNGAFVGRRQDLAYLHEKLDRSELLGRPLIVTGLAGVGKTALAVEYAYQYGLTCAAVWWIRGIHEETIADDLAALGVAVGCPGTQPPARRQAVEFARTWLSQHRGWLLICDDISGPHLLDLFASVGTGRVLGTSRLLSWRGKVEVCSLMPLSAADAKALIVESGVDDQSVAGELAEASGGHPLAIRVAVAQLRNSGALPGSASGAASRGSMLRGWERILPSAGRHPDERATPLEATLESAVGELLKGSVAAARILSLSSFLAETSIPQLVFSRALSSLFPPGSQLSETIQQDIDTLVDLNLLGRTGGELLFHSVIQNFVRSRLEGDDLRVCAKLAVSLLVLAFPTRTSESEASKLCSQLLPHSYSAVGHAEELKVGLEESAALLLRVGDYFFSRGEFGNARQSYYRALAASDRAELKTPIIAAVLHERVGAVCEELGDLVSAENHYRFGLSTASAESTSQEQEHVIHLLAALARVSQAKGNLNSSEELLRRALALAERLYPDHLLLTRLLIQYSDVLHAQGQLEEARKILERAIQAAESRLGPISDESLACQDRLGVILGELGQYQDARKWFERAVGRARKGKNQVALARTLNHLGNACQVAGALDQAFNCYHEALSINKGLDHRDPESMGIALKNLGETFIKVGNYAEAKKHLELALQMLEISYGPTHSICRSVSLALALASGRQK